MPLKFQREGITYDELPDEEKDLWDALEWDDDGTVPDRVEAEAVNKWLFNKDTVDKVLAHLMTRGLTVAGGDRLGKTILFAKNQAHAEFIAERFNASYPHYKGEFARVITFKTEYAQSLIESFSNKEKNPHLAISVDMLDTGIDIPEVTNLVFFKLVRSKTKFWQMVGRGTRLCPDLFSPGQDKELFYIFDYCQNLEYFSQDIPATEGSAADPLGKRLFNARLELIATLDHQGGEAESGKLEEPAYTYGDPETNDAVRRSPRRSLAARSRGDESRQLRGAPTAPARREIREAGILGIAAGRGPDRALARGGRAAIRVGPGERGGQAIRPARAEPAAQPPAARARLRPAVRSGQADRRTARGKVRHPNGARPDGAHPGRTDRRVVAGRHCPDAGSHASSTSGAWSNSSTSCNANRSTPISRISWVARSMSTCPVFAPGTDYAKFKAKARAFSSRTDGPRRHREAQKEQTAHRGTDIAELERMLVESGLGARDELRRAAEESQGLGLFVRSLVGMDRSAAKDVMQTFLAGKSLTANQIEFVNLVVDHLTEHGIVTPDRLYESPFTDITPRGPDGLFNTAELDELMQVLKDRASNGGGSMSLMQHSSY